MTDYADFLEERITFSRDDLTLGGILAYPAASAPERLVLICAPHPNFAGDMENNIVIALARALAIRAVTLRFDYHGVGASPMQLPPGVSIFDYWQEIEESGDYSPAVADVAAAARFLAAQDTELEMDVIGYSFGAAAGLRYGLGDPRVRRLVGIAPPLARVDFSFLAGCTKPCLLLCGGRDFVCGVPDLLALAEKAGPCARAEIVSEEDHFFRGYETEIADLVAGFLEMNIGK